MEEKMEKETKQCKHNAFDMEHNQCDSLFSVRRLHDCNFIFVRTGLIHHFYAPVAYLDIERNKAHKQPCPYLLYILHIVADSSAPFDKKKHVEKQGTQSSEPLNLFQQLNL